MGLSRKSDVLRIYEMLGREDDRAGLVLFQENIMTVESLTASLLAIEQLASGEVTPMRAQEIVNLYATSYPYAVYQSAEVDWEARAQGLRDVLGII